MDEMNIPICRLCRASKSQQKVRSPYVFGADDSYKFWQCGNCNSIYLYPVPSIEDEKRFYAEEFEKFMSSRAGDDRDWSNAKRHKLTSQEQVKRRFPFVEPYFGGNKTLLEVGCSSGFMLDAFKEHGLFCTGVEPSGVFREYLLDSGYEVYDDLSEIRNTRFDLIVSFFVLEHIREPIAFLKQLHGLLEDDGVCICEVPCANDVLTSLYEIDTFERFYWSVAHHYYYTPESIQYIMEKLGFHYKLVPEQRYDLSNHMVWMMEGKPGGQGRYKDQLGEGVMEAYKKSLLKTWQCDTMFLYFWKSAG